jgi:hypothetical protein
LNEGFQIKHLRAAATALGRAIDAKWGAFKLIEECLTGSGVAEDEANAAVVPLRALRDLRNVLKGHGAPHKRSALEKQARTRFGSFRAHFVDIATKCDVALELVMRTLDPKAGAA